MYVSSDCLYCAPNANANVLHFEKKRAKTRFSAVAIQAIF